MADVEKRPDYQEALKAKDNGASLDKLINDRAKVLLQGQERNVGDPKSIYYLPPVDKLAQLVPGIQDLKVYKLLAPAIAAGVDLSDTGVVMNLVTNMVDKKQLSLTEAASDVSAMYHSAQVANFMSKQAVVLGLNPKLSYIVNGKDYTDTTTVSREIMKSFANKLIEARTSFAPLS
jgi:hypothetical protein